MKLLRLSLFLVAVCFASCNKVANIIPEPNPQPKPVTPGIVILGSSTAAGAGVTSSDSSWANRLHAAVSAQMKVNFTNLAISGYTTYQAMQNGYSVASRPAPDTAHNITKALSLKPTLVLINFPSNDIANNYTDSEIMANFNKMAHLLDSAKVQYIIFGTQPRNFPTAAQRLRLKTLNDEIKTAFTYRAEDFLNQLSNPDYSIKAIYSAGDGIHLNDAGHAIIYNVTIDHPVLRAALNLK